MLGSRAYQAICRDARALQFSTKVFRRRRPLFLALREITSRCNEEPHRAECTAACPAAAQQATVCTAAFNAVPRLIAQMRRISAGYESRVRRSRKPENPPPSGLPGAGRGRINGAEKEWHDLLTRLDSINALELFLRSDCPKDCNGREISAGFFTLPKNDWGERTICNRRSRNKTEQPLGTCAATMSYGPAFCDLRLRQGEYLRGSGDNLPDFYHTQRLARF